MADITKTIEIIFGGKDNLSGTISGVKSDLQEFDAGVQGVAEPVGNFTKSLLAVEVAIATVGAAMVGLSINEAGKFSTAVTEIGTLFNGTTEEVASLQQGLLDYAKSSTSSIEEINEATYIAISTGTDWTEVNIALAESEKLAAGGAASLETSTGALSRTMNAYGLEAKDAKEVSEALFTAVQNGDTNMNDLAANIGKVATTASGAGVGLDELLAAVSAVTIAGVSTSEAMTLLKALFKELATPSAELSDALGGMTLETNSLQEIMQQLQKATGGTLEGFNEIFPSIEATQGAMILGNDAAGAFAGTLDAMADKAGKLDDAYGNMAESFVKVNQNFVNNLRGTLIEVGVPLLDEYGTAVKALSNLLGGIGEGVGAPNFTTVYDAVDNFVNNFSSKVDEIAKALPEAMSRIDFSDLLESFTGISDALGDAFDSVFGSGLDLSKPEDLAKALQGAVNLLSSFIDLTKGIINGFSPVYDALGEAANRLGDTSSKTAETTGEVLAAFTMLKEFGTGVGAFLIIIKESQVEISNVFDVLQGTVGIVVNSMQLAFDAFAIVVFKVAKTMAEVLNLVTWGDTAQGFRDSAKELNDYAEAASANFESNMQDLTDSFDTMADGLGGGVDVDKTAEDLDKLGDKAGEAAKPLDELGESTEEVATALEEEIPNATDTTEKALEDLTDSTEKADEAQKGIKKTMVDGVATFQQTEKSTKELKEETDKAKEAAEQLKLEYSKLEVELEEIASNERIKSIEFFVQLETAKVEADAKKIVAAFESVAQSYEATSNQISELYGGLGDSGLSRSQEIDLQSSIDAAEQLQREQWETQKKLIEAQIEQIEAATERTNRGDSLITVDGGELQPELEAIMQSLFRSIRIKMSADYENYLFGLAP